MSLSHYVNSALIMLKLKKEKKRTHTISLSPFFFLFSQKNMEINGRWFTDNKTKRTLLFKGVNLGGGTKLPVGIASHERQGYWVDYDRHITFVGRPFPLEEADEHLQRLVNLGFNLLRFIITWEAVEHEGP